VILKKEKKKDNRSNYPSSSAFIYRFDSACLEIKDERVFSFHLQLKIRVGWISCFIFWFIKKKIFAGFYGSPRFLELLPLSLYRLTLPPQSYSCFFDCFSTKQRRCFSCFSLSFCLFISGDSSYETVIYLHRHLLLPP